MTIDSARYSRNALSFWCLAIRSPMGLRVFLQSKRAGSASSWLGNLSASATRQHGIDRLRLTVLLEFVSAERMEAKRLRKARQPAKLKRHLREQWMLVGRVHPERLHGVHRVRVDRLQQQRPAGAQARAGQLQELDQRLVRHVLHDLDRHHGPQGTVLEG